eukprot:Phypoly_transcript_04314.p1 GENE.Phypoly_transcript_04314~~Phypoly_transcript_04314.p1  ORF type:complete len:657 (+),score=128.79 Phypoly_transcript_04314:100-2070(+)
MTSLKKIAEGQYTTTIYGLINEGKYVEVVALLQRELEDFQGNRAALSLLGYSFYMLQNYAGAASCYEQLAKAYPDVNEYKIYHSQSLYKAGVYQEAQKVAQSVQDEQYTQRMLKLQVNIKLEQDDVPGTKSLLEQCIPDDSDTIIANACVLYKEGKYQLARQRFSDAMSQMGYQPSLAYNIALCHYRMKQYTQARKNIIEIIEKAIREHPELGVGSGAHSPDEDLDVHSVGNSQTLQETAIIEAENLKAAIEFEMKNMDLAKESLQEMPPRTESELDPVTLHNMALMNMEDDASGGFEKLGFLLTSSPMPPETFANLLLLYCKYGYFDLAADVLAENQHLVDKYLDKETADFLEAIIMRQSAPEDAYRKLDDLAKKHIDVLRKMTKQVGDAKHAREDDSVREAIKNYDEALEKYIPVLMGQAKIYWDHENYQQVEKMFRQSNEFCREHDIWKLNVAHNFFIQDKPHLYKEAIKYYEPIVKKNSESILSITAIVLANLCVAYIMTSENEAAEDLMRKIEKEEERVGFQEPDKKIYHLCIVNLVIGTLYCAKGNFEFGISRIIKSLEPYQKKLDTDTWFYAKRCFVALAETLAKHTCSIFKDSSMVEVLAFLDAADVYGKTIPASIAPPITDPSTPPVATISQEARALKKMFLALRGW